MIQKYSVLKNEASFKEDDVWLEYHDIYSDKQNEIVSVALSSNKGDKQHWDLIPAGQLIKAWNDFVKLGVVRNEKILDTFVKRIIENTAQLQVLTELMGHSDYNVYPDIQESSELSDEDIKKLRDVFENSSYPEFEDGSWMLSDYGLPKVKKLIPQLYSAKTAEDKLIVIDQILNIVHQRSDFARFYVEGGADTLNKLSGK